MTMNIKHQTKLEVIRNNAVICVVEPKQSEKTNDYQLSSNSSIFEFPTASLATTNAEINSLLLGFSKSDLVRISMSHDGADYISIFTGEFLSKKITKERDDHNLQINAQAVHSFFKLSLLNLTDTHKFNKTKFGDVISWLANSANIPSEIYINDSLGESLISGTVNKINAFRLFKEVCSLKGAIVTFNSDNSVHIEYKKEKVAKIRLKAPITITDNEIISFESNDKI